jgi:hypothetical protein
VAAAAEKIGGAARVNRVKYTFSSYQFAVSTFHFPRFQTTEFFSPRCHTSSQAHTPPRAARTMTPDTHGASTSASKRRAGRVSRAIRRAPVVSFLVLLCVTSSLFFVPVAGRKALSAKRPAGIITTDGGRFVDPSDGSTFHVAGANCYYLAYSSGAESGSYEHDWVAEVLREATSLKLNVLRVWAFQDQWWQKDRALQTSPGE